MSTYIEKLEKYTLPTIAMRGFVVFPQIPTSFEISRPSAVKVIEKAVIEDGYIFIVAQKEIGVEEPKAEDLYSVGILAKIKQALKLPDNTYRVLVEGYARAELVDFNYLPDGSAMSEVIKKEIHIDGHGGLKGEALMRKAYEVFDEYVDSMPRVANEIRLAVQSIKDPGLLCDFIAANILFKYQDKQEILAMFDPLKRVELLVLILEREIELLQIEKDINKKVQVQINKNQREHYLREQLRVIQNELGQNQGEEYSENEDLYDTVMNSKMPEDLKSKLAKEVLKLERMPFGSAEATVIRNYVETCLELPWGKYTKDRISVEKAKKILDQDHYGLEKVKERILEFLSVKQLAPQVKGQILLLVGPPGVGKTSIAASIARALKRSFVRASLGGVRDEADIRGHRKTYIGAMPGRIINALKQSESMNPLFCLDELDKLTRDAHGDPASALLEVLDSEQNTAFRDHFIEMPVDLSECIFIATANTTETIPRPLLDRMEIIQIQSYTENEKVMIAKQHLLPKQLKRHGLTKASLVLTDDAIRELIRCYTKESGVRNLEREIAHVCRRVSKRIVEGDKKRHVIDRGGIVPLIGRHKVKPEHVPQTPLVGVVNGLAWTEVGGELLKIEALSLEGTGKIELTGSLGDVMKESAKTAISLIRALADRLGIEDKEFYKNRDIHIHAPEGAVPKDGPSAGITMTTAIASELCAIPVKSDIAMTGEITLRGNVLPIGGLREKTMAAYAAGIRTIIIPYDNLEDLEDVDPEVRENVEFVPAKTIEDVFRVAFCPTSERLCDQFSVKDSFLPQIKLDETAVRV